MQALASLRCLGLLRSLRGLRGLAAALLGALAWAGGTPALAAVVTYEAVALGANAWRYDYVVKNDGSPAVIEEFTIFFDYATYADLAVAASPVGWDPLVVPPDPNLPADAYFDALALGAGLLSGQEALFSVSFTYSGLGTPGAQEFHIVDPGSFGVIERGVTQVAAIPEPGTLALLLLTLAIAVLSGHGHAVQRAMVRRRLSVIAGGTAVLLGMAGCGGGSGQAGTQQPAATARQQALAVGGTAPNSVAGLRVDAMTQVAERRIGRTEFEYDYRLRIANSGGPLIGVTVELVGAGTGTQVVDSFALAGTLAGGGTATPTDTITIRQDRTRVLQPNQLSWRFALAPVLQGTAAVGAALANASVDVTDQNRNPACYEPQIFTNGIGGFTCTVRAGAVAPLLVVVRDAFQAYPPLVSIVASLPPAGSALVANATPLTTAIVSQLAPNGNALALIADRSLIDLQRLATITANVLAQLQPVLDAVGVPTGYNPFTSPIVASTLNQTGNTADHLLEVLRFSTVNGVNRIGTIDNPAGVPVAGLSPAPTLPAPSPGALALGTTMQLMTNAFNACYALPVSQRVLATNTSIPVNQGGSEVTSLGAACQNIWHGDYRHSGFRAGQRYYGALRDTAMVNAVFSLPEVMLYRDDTSSADNDVAVLNFRFVDANGISSNTIEVARKLPGSGSVAHPTDWWLHGNRGMVDASVRPVVRRSEQLVANPGTPPFQLTGASRFEVGVDLFINKDGPASSGLRAVRVTGPGLPAPGIVLTRVHPSIITDQNWMNIRRKDGLTDPASATFSGTGGNNFLFQRTRGISGPDGTTLRPNPNNGNADNTAFPNWAHPLDYGLQIGTVNFIDFTPLTAGTAYSFEFFYDGESAPRYVESKSILAPVVPSTYAINLQWIDLSTATRRYLNPVDALAQAQTAMNLAWIANPFAETVASAGVYTGGGGLSVNDAIINFPRGVTSAQAVAPNGTPFPALTSDGTSGRSIQLRYRVLDGGYKDSFTRYN